VAKKTYPWMYINLYVNTYICNYIYKKIIIIRLIIFYDNKEFTYTLKIVINEVELFGDHIQENCSLLLYILNIKRMECDVGRIEEEVFHLVFKNCFYVYILFSEKQYYSRRKYVILFNGIFSRITPSDDDENFEFDPNNIYIW